LTREPLALAVSVFGTEHTVSLGKRGAFCREALSAALTFALASNGERSGPRKKIAAYA
jgi:hypothetical protein